jgi:hypothetical protein
MGKPLLKHPLPLDWKKKSWRNPFTGEMGLEYHTPIYIVLVSGEGRVNGEYMPPMVSFSRKDRQPPSETEVARIRAMLIGDYDWNQDNDRMTEEARAALRKMGAVSGPPTPNVKWCGRPKPS